MGLGIALIEFDGFFELGLGRLEICLAKVGGPQIVMCGIKVRSERDRLLIMRDSFVAFLILVRVDALVEFLNRVFREVSPVLRRINEVRIAPWPLIGLGFTLIGLTQG